MTSDCSLSESAASRSLHRRIRPTAIKLRISAKGALARPARSFPSCTWERLEFGPFFRRRRGCVLSLSQVRQRRGELLGDLARVSGTSCPRASRS